MFGFGLGFVWGLFRVGYRYFRACKHRSTAIGSTEHRHKTTNRRNGVSA